MEWVRRERMDTDNAFGELVDDFIKVDEFIIQVMWCVISGEEMKVVLFNIYIFKKQFTPIF